MNLGVFGQGNASLPAALVGARPDEELASEVVLLARTELPTGDRA